jgi:glycosyltransferase involved in cell wall biosynthesis
LPDKIRVCLVSVNSYPLFNDDCDAPFGGAELQIFLIAKHLAQDRNYLVSVIVGDYGQDENEVRHNVRLVKAYRRNGTLAERLFAPFKLFRAIGKANPDVVIQRASGPETGICALYASLKNKKFIYSVAHNAEMVGKSVASHHPLYRRLYEYGVNRADKIVVQSQDQMRSLTRMNEHLSAKAVIISNSIEARPLPTVNRDSILWIARAQSWKRPEIFIRLANTIKTERLVMVMPVTERTDEIKKIQDKAVSMPNIEFLSSIDFKSSQQLFNKSKVFVNTSTWEGFPNTFLQAGMSATPIVSLEVDPDNFIKNNRCGFVCDGDFSILEEKVSFLLKNEKAWQEASQNCHNYVMGKHNIQKNIVSWKNLICESGE